MAEGVEIRKGKGKLKRLDTNEVADKLTPDEVEDFRDAFEVGLGQTLGPHHIFKTMQHFFRFLTRMATVGSAWLSWVRC